MIPRPDPTIERPERPAPIRPYDRSHKITVELQPHELPPARPLWHEAFVDALQVLRSSGDLTARGAAILLERLGLIENKGRAA